MLKGFFRPAQPADLYPRVFRSSKTEMEAQIVLGTKTAAASNLLHLPPAIRVDGDTRTNGGAIGPRSDQLHQQPGVCGRRLIAQQGRIVIQIVDDDVDSSCVEDIAKGGASTAS